MLQREGIENTDLAILTIMIKESDLKEKPMRSILPTRKFLPLLCAMLVISACQTPVDNSPNAPADYADVRRTDMS